MRCLSRLYWKIWKASYLHIETALGLYKKSLWFNLHLHIQNDFGITGMKFRCAYCCLGSLFSFSCCMMILRNLQNAGYFWAVSFTIVSEYSKILCHLSVITGAKHVYFSQPTGTMPVDFPIILLLELILGVQYGNRIMLPLEYKCYVHLECYLGYATFKTFACMDALLC